MEKYIYALGFFDGVHVGHEALLRRCLELSRAHGCGCGVVTFAGHPDTLVLGQTPGLINTAADRERLLRSFQIERVVTLPFDETLRDTPWEEFLYMLRRDYGAAGFVCGDDFRFGCRGAGTAAILKEYCAKENLPCDVVQERTVDGIRVSSSFIRTLLEKGDMAACRRFLGHPHILTGTVVPGKHLGRTLGIPTANLSLPSELAVPCFGVYACRVKTPRGQFMAVTNVGTRPTVAGHGITVESWLLDFAEDLYGEEITVEFYDFLRPEVKFDTLQAMQEEILRNAKQTRAFFAKNS